MENSENCYNYPESPLHCTNLDLNVVIGIANPPQYKKIYSDSDQTVNQSIIIKIKTEAKEREVNRGHKNGSH